MGAAAKRLKKARRVRHRNATVFHRLEIGKITLYSVLRDPPASLGNVDIWDILRRTPKLGREGAKHVCLRAKIWPHTRLSALTKEQREALLRALPERVAKVPDPD